jgi:glucosylceramidase
MINDLNRWTVGWIDWNLLLDTTGGPNHVGNLCSAPVLADVERDALAFQSSYAAIGHFARFVRVGAQRVLCASNKEVLECAAFLNPDGVVATVVLNRSEQSQAFDICTGTHTWSALLPPRSIATYQFSYGVKGQREGLYA